MGSSKGDRKRKRAPKQSSNEDFSDDFRNFKNLFPVILSPEGMRPPVLKDLYRLLVHLSLNAQWSVKQAVGACDFELEICHDGIKATFGDIHELSNILFKELDELFEQLFSNLRGISANKDLGESSSSLGLFDTVEVMKLLFRCCILLISLLSVKQILILEKGVILLRILKRLSLPNLVENTGKRGFVFEKSVFRECAPAANGCSTSSVEDFTASLQFLEPHNPLLFFKSTMLEVFIDELLTHGHLRGYFKMINFVASANDMLFNPHSAQGDTGIVIEAICNHFIISFSDKQAFGDFLSRLFDARAKEFRYPFGAPALSVTAAVSLLLSPIMVSAPKYVQAHLVSLASEALDIKCLKPDRKLTNLFLSTFERSVILYMKHMSCLQTDGYSIISRGFESCSSHDIAYPPFESYISPGTKGKVESLTIKLDESSKKNLNDGFFRMKSDLVSSSLQFVKECQNGYAISRQDEILAILSFLVLKASESYDDKAIRQIEGTSLQHICLLASLLKLVSISMLQAIWCLRYSDDLCCPKTLKDFSSCKEYDFILGTISCFRDLEISLPLQQDLSSVMSSHSARHMVSKIMFLHFSGLMSLCFASGLDCLVKASLLTIIALLNLFVFEEGDLDALQSVVDSNKESFSSKLPLVRLQETVVDQNSSLVVASKFQKIRSLCSSVMENEHNETEAVAGLGEETEETSNGEIFLKCMLKTGEDIANFDDLVGFVECRQGKDYSDWLKNRERFRRWRFEKTAVLKWKRKKKTLKTVKGKRN